MSDLKMTEHEKACIEEQAGHPVDFDKIVASKGLTPVMVGNMYHPSGLAQASAIGPPSAHSRLHLAAVRLLDELTQAYVTDEAKSELRAAINAYEGSRRR